MLARPGVEKGRHVPDRHAMKELSKDPKKIEEHAEAAKSWIQAVSLIFSLNLLRFQEIQVTDLFLIIRE